MADDGMGSRRRHGFTFNINKHELYYEIIRCHSLPSTSRYAIHRMNVLKMLRHKMEFPAKIPSYKDWREHQVLNEVRNQGHCNCCWAIVACTVVAAMLKITKKSTELVLLSPQDLINCNKPENDSDYNPCQCYKFTVNKAFRYIVDNGVRYERDCEFRGKRGDCLPHDEFTETVKIRGFIRIDDGDEETLLNEVSKHPVAAVVKVSKQLENLKEQIYVGPEPYVDTDTLRSHAVVIVGYGRHEQMRINYWIVMSSWGKDWGSGGFGRIARDSSLPPSSKPLLIRASFPLVD